MSIATTTPYNITQNTAESGGTFSGVATDYYPITHRLLLNRFQLMKATNEKLSADAKSTIELRPFQMFQDSKQSDKKFVLTGFAFRPISNRYDDVQLLEYDNTTSMTLNIT